MTVHYNQKLLDASTITKGFYRVMLIWRGSIYKLVLVELMLFCCIYTILSWINFNVLDEKQRNTFQMIASYSNDYSLRLPLAFVLGFFADTCVKLFFRMPLHIIWSDQAAYLVGGLILGNNEEARLIRRSIIRYIFFANLLMFAKLSKSVKKRFPNLKSYVDHGIITEKEMVAFKKVDKVSAASFSIPYVWATHLVMRAREKNYIVNELGVISLVSLFKSFEKTTSDALALNEITVPLGYTQVVITAVITFLAACLIGRHPFEFYNSEYFIPFMTLAQVTFFIGWLKVSLHSLNSMGEGDDDLELIDLIDTYLQVGFNIVDHLLLATPKFEKDPLWGKPDAFIPYTRASIKTMATMYLGSLNEFNLKNTRVATIPLKKRANKVHPKSI